MKQVISRLLLLMSNAEAFFNNPGEKRLFIRRIFLKINNIQPPACFWIGHGFFLMKGGNLSLGKNCAIGENSTIANHAQIDIGNDFISAGGLILNSGSHSCHTMVPDCKRIKIGSRVWCGQNVTILSGVEIGDDVVIGACSLVNKAIPSNSIVAGVPARIIRRLDRPTSPNLWSWAHK